MAVWWVNQGATYALSLKQAMLWSPDSQSRPHWRHMHEAQVGDVVIHYARGAIRALGVVATDARNWPRPEGFKKEWSGVGVMLRVDYQVLDNAIPIDDVPIELRSDQIFEGPFTVKHGVKQGYLWAATPELYDWVAARAGVSAPQLADEDPDAGEAAPSGSEPERGQRRHFEGPLDVVAPAPARGEQASLRRFIFGRALESECAVCGRLLPVGFLRAAHIKRRSACSDDERRDFRAVAMPACVLGCDALFELGWISVDDQGVIRAVGALTGAIEAARADVVGRTCKAFSEWTAPHFAWHREQAAARKLPLELVEFVPTASATAQ